MRKLILALAATAALAGCTSTEQGAAIGAVAAGGTALAVTGDAGTTIVAAAAGGIAGALIGRAAQREDYCEYRRRGRIVIDRCPSGYDW